MSSPKGPYLAILSLIYLLRNGGDDKMLHAVFSNMPPRPQCTIPSIYLITSCVERIPLKNHLPTSLMAHMREGLCYFYFHCYFTLTFYCKLISLCIEMQNISTAECRSSPPYEYEETSHYQIFNTLVGQIKLYSLQRETTQNINI